MTDPGPEDNPNPTVAQLSETLLIPQLEHMIRGNINRVQLWMSKMPARIRNRVELRLSSAIPTHIITFVDPARLSSLMHVEFLPLGCDPGDRPSMDISVEKGGKLFQRYYREYKRLWDNGKQVT